ncbi:hypothetical protein [Novosphingobium beihaiensis]|uniref:Uncharacterized protein n=1 Tax=Novosphingobium beihaiensis TaxID=2930389 RepID=A0ABT0BS62_9SPHN|nr:hypothetical protein [Novosphingobium beihaiensis]MCJ2187902.1 hypothetical protein [Novosphingobium beihaiensis]
MDHRDNDLANSFARKAAQDDPTPSSDWENQSDAVKGGSGLEVERIVAAILSDNHRLNAEELRSFEDVLNEPGMSADQRQEFLQTLWNVVVGIIDFRWECMRSPVAKIGCESNGKSPRSQHQTKGFMLNCEGIHFSHNQEKAAATKSLPERKA